MSTLRRALLLLRADRRGVAAMEGAIIFGLMLALLLPITDVAQAVIKFMAANQAMRDLATYAQFHPPPDITNTSSWSSSLPHVSGFTITGTVLCGTPPTGSACASGATNQYFKFQTRVTLNPVLVNAFSGTYTLTYNERF